MVTLKARIQPNKRSLQCNQSALNVIRALCESWLVQNKAAQEAHRQANIVITDQPTGWC